MKNIVHIALILLIGILIACTKDSPSEEATIRLSPVLENTQLSLTLLRSTSATPLIYAIQVYENDQPSFYGLFDDVSKMTASLSIGKSYTIKVAAFPTFDGNGIKWTKLEGVSTYFLPDAIGLNNQFINGNVLAETMNHVKTIAPLSYYKETTVTATAGMSTINLSLSAVEMTGNESETPQRVYWDMADQPECRALANYRTTGALTTFAPADLSEVEWGGPAIANMTYSCIGNHTNTTFDQKAQYVYGDFMRFRFSPTANSWFEWKLPSLNAGIYCVWFGWRRETPTTFRTVFMQEGKKDQELQNLVDLSGYGPILYSNTTATTLSYTEEQNLADGYKQYTAKFGNSVVPCKMLGIIRVESTGRHTLRFENLTGRSGETSWDMIQFIPINEDQLWPRVDMLGNMVYRNTPDNQIWPYTTLITSNYQGN